jgi:sporulation protein YlmC with PRC-barrel domain
VIQAQFSLAHLSDYPRYLFESPKVGWRKSLGVSGRTGFWVFQNLKKQEGDVAMKRTWKTAYVFGTALSLLVVTQAFGQVRQPGQEDSAQRRQAGQQQAGQKTICLASKLTEMQVKDKSNQALGKIEDLVIDQDGQVQYLAINTHAQAGAARQQPGARTQPGQPGQPGQRAGQAGQKLTLVPFDAVEIHSGETEAQNYVSLNIDKDKLSQAPSFTEQQLTSQAGQAQWMSQVDQFFDREKEGAARPDLNDQDKNREKRENDRDNDNDN